MRTPVSAEASSTGQTFAATSWLDIRFEVNRAAYEAQARAVGIQPGWRVLDAGCGSGGFLPILAELAGWTRWIWPPKTSRPWSVGSGSGG
jgi:2-polyprenyl-3-methyl-5-hydroxy-6-metoxy-1,4-benzoquinol methylase